MMSAEMTASQVPKSRFPAEGVRVGINHHPSTLGKHRVRLSFSPEVAHELARGLGSPRVNVEGTLVNGLRVWCAEDGRYAPIQSRHTGAWSLTMPARQLRGREDVVNSLAVTVEWERDEQGPVLLIPRLPDPMLPEPLLDKLPNAAVDPATRMERANSRLKRELERARIDNVLGQPAPKDESLIEIPEAESVLTRPELIEHPHVSPDPEEAPPARAESSPVPDASRDIVASAGAPLERAELAIPEASDPVPNDAAELKEALGLVNELVDRLGENVVLFIDQHGRVQAKRRVISYIDL